MEVAGKKTVKMLDEISEIDFEESGNIDNPNSVINQVANQYNNNVSTNASIWIEFGTNL